MNAPLPPSGAVHRFKGWELRTDEHLLLVDGRPARLGRPAYKLLLALIEAGGRVVGKDALMQTAWEGRVVEDNNLRVQITALRERLPTNTIVNVPGFGYRLHAEPAPEPVPGSAIRPVAALAAVPRPALFGRAGDVAAVCTQLREHPLVTIVGTGGVGKTALAHAVLEATGTEWTDGAHWLDLAPLRSATPLLPLVARLLGLVPEGGDTPTDDFVQSLTQRHALVVLDNCEHLLADVIDLLRPLLGPRGSVRFLATSQETLRLAGGTDYALAPLTLPRAGAEPAALQGSSALALFTSRVCGADPRFQFGPDELEKAAELCRQLDGLPLALEMAAARVATLGLEVVSAQIGERLRLRSTARDAPQRHSTLLETFNWSYGLLSPVEQRVFRRLEPFVGGFTPQMAQQLCCGVEGGDADGPALSSWEMLDALSALVEKSLVQRAAPGHTVTTDRRYLLESARDFARLQLEASGETPRVRHRHAEIVADAFELAPYELQRWRDADWGAKYVPERRNVGEALRWACTAREPALLARLVAALAQLDTFALSDAEVLAYPVPIDMLLQAPPRQRARACLEYGWAYYLAGNRETGSQLLERALADYEALDDVAGVFGALVRLVRMIRGRPGHEAHAAALWARLKAIEGPEIPLRTRLSCNISVATHFEGRADIERLWRLQRIAQSSGFDGHAARCQLHITDELLSTGRYEEAAAVARGMLRDHAAASGPGLRAVTCQNLALALVRMGRYEEARAPAQMLLRAMPSAAHLVMDLFAWVALQTGRAEQAAQIAGRSAQIKRERDWASEPAERALIEDTLAGLHEALGPAVLAEQMQYGAAMSTAGVMALVWKPAADAG